MSSADPSLSLPHQSHTVLPDQPYAPFAVSYPLPLSPPSIAPSCPDSHHFSCGHVENAPCHPSELSTHSLAIFYLSNSPFSIRPFPCQPFVPLSTVTLSLAAIDTNLRNFCEMSICHHITVDFRPGAFDTRETIQTQRVQFDETGDVSEQGKPNEIELSSHHASQNDHPWSADIWDVNETNQSGTNIGPFNRVYIHVYLLLFKVEKYQSRDRVLLTFFGSYSKIHQSIRILRRIMIETEK